MGVGDGKILMATVGQDLCKNCNNKKLGKSWSLLGVVGGSGRLCMSASRPPTRVSGGFNQLYASNPNCVHLKAKIENVPSLTIQASKFFTPPPRVPQFPTDSGTT